MRSTQEHGFRFLIIGVGLGLLVRFLWAPRAGKETRDEFRRSADGGLAALTKEAEKVRSGIDHWFAGMKQYFGGNKAQRRDGLREQTSQQE
jgi:gas vesicle protein